MFYGMLHTRVTADGMRTQPNAKRFRQCNAHAGIYGRHGTRRALHVTTTRNIMNLAFLDRCAILRLLREIVRKIRMMQF